eukprot:15441827-Alexandrium_andersonii.AAC.1
MGYRIQQAEAAFKKLHIIWKAPTATVSLKLKLRVYVACIRSRLVYGIGPSWLTATQLRKLEAYQC